MTSRRRVVDELRDGLQSCLAADPLTLLLGQDVVDPYGGAFKVTRGLSTQFPQQVLSTPISENAITGIAAGLALQGRRVVLEIMFADFLALCFDQIVNFAAKSVTMYGKRVPMSLVVRAPSGGGRGYGPTHSQSPVKHFLGVPNLSVYQVTEFHHCSTLLRELLAQGSPALLFEHKLVYPRYFCPSGAITDDFSVAMVSTAENPLGHARIYFDGATGQPDVVLVATAGVVPAALSAMRSLLYKDDMLCELLVPARLYPFDATVLVEPGYASAVAIVLDDGPGDAGWGDYAAAHVDRARVGTPSPGRVSAVCAPCAVRPAAPRLEAGHLITSATIEGAVRDALG